MSSWWSGTRLVFERGFLETVRSQSFKWVTGLLLLLSTAAVVLPQMLADRTETYTLATVGEASPELTSLLEAAAVDGDFEMEYAVRRDEAAVKEAVREGDAAVGLTAEAMYVASRDVGTFPGVVAQAVVTLETSRRLAAADLSSSQLAALRSIEPPTQVSVGAAVDEARMVVGLAAGITLELAILLAGGAIATAVALEKATRISEVLLATLRPGQIMTGTVLAMGTVTLTELLLLAAPLAVSIRVSDSIGLPAVATADIALGLVWFLLGFALYAFVYAAIGSLVNKVTEVNTAVYPVSMTIFAGYLASFYIILDDPESVWSALVSMFPVTAPLAMPMRWASGEVPAYQLLVAMTLTVLAAVLLAWIASTVYRRALLISGRRVKVREVLGSWADLFGTRGAGVQGR